jgi:hypothetical protein
MGEFWTASESSHGRAPRALPRRLAAKSTPLASLSVSEKTSSSMEIGRRSTSSSGGTPSAPLTRSQMSSLRARMHFRAWRTQRGSGAAVRSTCVSHVDNWEKDQVVESEGKSVIEGVAVGRSGSGEEVGERGNVCARREKSLEEGGVDMRAATSEGRSMKGRKTEGGRGVKVTGCVFVVWEEKRGDMD